MVEGEYVVCPFNLLVPEEPNAEEGIGGLVNCSISTNEQYIDALEKGKVCYALACQCPSEEDTIQCCTQECQNKVPLALRGNSQKQRNTTTMVLPN